jgi:hypothetical protein
MRRIIFLAFGMVAVAAVILGCASPAQATAPAAAKHVSVRTLPGDLPPECITVNVRHRHNGIWRTWYGVMFCGTGPSNTPSGDSPLRDVVARQTISIGWLPGNCVKVWINENSGNGPIVKAPFCARYDSPMRDVMAGKTLIVDGGPLQSGAVLLG